MSASQNSVPPGDQRPLEELARATLREALTSGSLTQRLECLPYVLPRVAPVPATKVGKDGKPVGDGRGATVVFMREKKDGDGDWQEVDAP